MFKREINILKKEAFAFVFHKGAFYFLGQLFNKILRVNNKIQSCIKIRKYTGNGRRNREKYCKYFSPKLCTAMCTGKTRTVYDEYIVDGYSHSQK